MSDLFKDVPEFVEVSALLCFETLEEGGKGEGDGKVERASFWERNEKGFGRSLTTLRLTSESDGGEEDEADRQEKGGKKGKDKKGKERARADLFWL